MRSDVTFVSLLLMVATQAACESSSSDDPAQDFAELDIAICAPDQGPFSTTIDNVYFPLPIGRQLVLEGVDDGEAIRVEIDVLDETEEVAGVPTRVVTETEYEDGELVEISRNFFAQAPDGTVCYFGEDVDDYEDGVIVAHEGAWRAGVGMNRAGIIMPGSPAVETQFYQEFAPAIAEDRSAVIDLAATINVPAGSFMGIHLIDWDPLDGDDSSDGEDKYYAENIGLAVDEEAELVSFF